MKGKRLYELISELSVSESKRLMYHCNHSSDKRNKLLYKLLQSKYADPAEFETALNKIMANEYRGYSRDKLDHVIRRNLQFFLEETENAILRDRLDKDKLSRNFLLFKALEKSQNDDLLEHYYSGVLREQAGMDDLPIRLEALRGNIRLIYFNRREAEYERVLRINEDIRTGLEDYYHYKYGEYFNNISNVYMDSHALLKIDVQQVLSEIDAKLGQCGNIENKISYLISQARLTVRTDAYHRYIRKAYDLLKDTALKESGRLILERKVLFLELISGYYLGIRKDKVLATTERILEISSALNFTDHNTQFYRLLLLLLGGEEKRVLEILSAEKKYFRSGNTALKDFLQAFIRYRNGNLNGALRALGELSYSSDYFISVFSKLFVIRIHLDLGNTKLIDSLIYNAERYIRKNSDKYLIFPSSQYVLKCFRKMNQHRVYKEMNPSEVYLPPFHAFLIR